MLSVVPFNVAPREEVADAISEATSTPELCRIARANGIDFIEVPEGDESNVALRELLEKRGFSAVGDAGQLVRFADVKGACGIP